MEIIKSRGDSPCAGPSDGRGGARSSADRGGPTLHSLERVSLPDGRSLCVRRRGRAGERPIVLLHGLLDSSAGWSELCGQLSCPYLAPDLPGFGHSDPPSQAGVINYARDVADGLKALGVGRFTLVGHSLGGAIATAVAELMPESVDALILLAPVGFGRIHMAEAAMAPGMRSVLNAALPWALSSRLFVTATYLAVVTNGRFPPAELVERVTTGGRNLVHGTREAIRSIAAAGRSSEAFHRRRAGYSGPVTAVWGDRDRLVPSGHQAGVRKAFPQARVEIWRGMGHHPANERLDDLIALIAEARSPDRANARIGNRPSLRLIGDDAARRERLMADAA
jgi:pimeloyl-ACP methyl ester carboxylesterase